MNPVLKDAFDRTVSLFESDPRVVAAYHSGSVGTDREDDYSDVDPVFLIDPEYFMEFDRQLPTLFGQEIARPILWWPERWVWQPGASENINIPRNYAIFFEVCGKLLQYDINIMAAPQKRQIKVSKGQFIFDKASFLEIVSQQPVPELDERKLVWTIQMYWIYVYIHAKYIKRRDLFKLLYAQQELFHEHLVVLQYLESNTTQGWWPLIASKVSNARKENLLRYFGQDDVDSITRALKDQLSLFSDDARQACVGWQMEYPDKFEDYVVKYLRRNEIM